MSTYINESYYQSIEGKIEALSIKVTDSTDTSNICSELNNIMQEVEEIMTKDMTNTQNQIDLLSELTTVPTDLASCISWIEKSIELYAKPYETAVATQTALLAKYTSLLSKIATQSDNFTCNLTLPEIEE